MFRSSESFLLFPSFALLICCTGRCLTCRLPFDLGPAFVTACPASPVLIRISFPISCCKCFFLSHTVRRNGLVYFIFCCVIQSHLRSSFLFLLLFDSVLVIQILFLTAISLLQRAIRSLCFCVLLPFSLLCFLIFRFPSTVQLFISFVSFDLIFYSCYLALVFMAFF